MSNALIEVEPFQGGTAHLWTDQTRFEAVQQDQREKILAKVGETEKERKEREKAEEALAKLEAQREAKIAGFHRLNHLWEEYQKTARLEQSARWKLQGAEEYLAGIVPTLEQWYFGGEHPTMGKDAPALMAIEFAMRGYGAQRVVDAFPAWLEKHNAKLSEMRKKIIDLARELHLEDELPEELKH